MSIQMKSKPKRHSYPIQHIFGKTGNTKGEVGIELETIGKRLPVEFAETRLWKCENDNSVKPRSGETALEYVLCQPVGRLKVSQALQELKREWDRCKSEIAEGRLSNSTHVHVNAQSMTMQQVATWMAVYYLFEEILVRWAGDDRIGNLFCLRGKDADGMIKMLAKAFSSERFDTFSLKTYRYSALNVCALPKYGSLEFRALRGTGDISVIQAWIETLLAIKDASLNYKNPVHVVERFKLQTPIGTCVAILPEPLKSFALSQADLTGIMNDGAQMVREFAYSIKWDDNPQKAPEREEQQKARSLSPGGLSQPMYVATDDTISTDSTWTVMTSPPTPQAPPVGHSSLYATYLLYRGTNHTYKNPSTPSEMNAARYYKLSPSMVSYCAGFNRRLEMRGSNGTGYLAIITASGALSDWVRGASMSEVS